LGCRLKKLTSIERMRGIIESFIYYPLKLTSVIKAESLCGKILKPRANGARGSAKMPVSVAF